MRKSLAMLGLVVFSGAIANGCSQGDSRGEVTSSSRQRLVSGAGSATLVIQSDWGSGYCAGITIANQGNSDITSWTLGISVPNAMVSSSWSGRFTPNGALLIIKPADFNATISRGASIYLGFCANTTGPNHTPSVASLMVVGGNTGGSGGAANTGGAAATGGVSPTGGTPATGGTIATGGANATGGDPATGGTIATGGTTGNVGQATIQTQTDWGTGYCDGVNVTNNGTVTSTSWTVVLSIPQASVSQAWSSTYTRNGDTVVFKPVSYNAAIAPGATVNFGYCATKFGSRRSSLVSVSLDLPSAGTGGATSTGGAPGSGGAQATGGAESTGGTTSISTCTICTDSEVCADLRTDPSNCGSCGHVCPGACSEGECQCATQSSTNALTNAGFDGSGTEGWIPYESDIVLSRATADVANCKDSGSLIVSNQDPNGLNSGAYQCVPVIGGKAYNFGAWVNTPSDQAKGETWLMLGYYSEDNCGGNVSVGTSLPTSAYDAWRYIHAENLTVPTNTKSAAVYLQVIKNGPDARPYESHFDALYLTPAPGKF